MLNLRDGQFGPNFNQVNLNLEDAQHEIIDWRGDADSILASNSEVHKIHDGKINNILAFDNSFVDASECCVSNNLYSEKSVIFATGKFNEIYCYDSSLVVIKGEFIRADVSQGSQLICIFDQEVNSINVNFDQSSEVVVIYDASQNFEYADKKILSSLETNKVKLIRYDELNQPSNNYLQMIAERFRINKTSLL